MSDPLDANCKRFSESGGIVTGVQLTHIAMPGTRYELVRAALIDENTARGTTIARVIVQDKDGIDAMVNCWMGWPWKGQWPISWEGKLLPGSADYPYQHVTVNAYNPATQPGPLAIYIGDASGTVDSDVIAGIGLPGGHHVSYHLVFRERSGGGGGGGTDTGGGGGGGGGTDTGGGGGTNTGGGDVAVQLQRIEDKLDRIARQFGIQF